VFGADRHLLISDIT